MSQLLPGHRVGIIGGSPQNLSIIQALQLAGYEAFIYRTEAEMDFPAADSQTTGSYEDKQTLMDFAQTVDALLILSNAVDIDIQFALSSKTRIYQSFELAEVAQNRLVEKLFLEERAINLAPYSLITTVGELPSALTSIGFPATLTANRPQGKEETYMIYDHDMDDHVLDMVTTQPCMLTAWLPTKRSFTVSVIKDFDNHQTILPITENTYVNGRLKFSIASKRMNPEWVIELKRIAYKVLEGVNGTGLVSLNIFMATNGIFYVDKVDRLPLPNQWFSQKQIDYSTAQLMVRLAVSLPINSVELKKETILIPIYQHMMQKIDLLSLIKPSWEVEYFNRQASQADDIVGVLRLSGDSSVDLLNEIDTCDIFQTK